MKKIVYISSAVSYLAAFSACYQVEDELPQVKQVLTIESDIQSYREEVETRVNIAGNDFEANDMIKLKVICPFTDSWQQGTSTWTGTRDNFWLLKWNSGWQTLTKEDGYDIDSSYGNSGSSDIFSVYESQATPYVYTASTWTEEKLVKDSDGTLVDLYCNVFHADQSRLKNYKASDVLWAQQYSQTGTWNIHLSFNHVMAALQITIDDDALAKKISEDAVLTLEGMPAIDQAEIIVGDYYAPKDISSYRYGYKQKNPCDYDNNGKVIGVASIGASVCPLSGTLLHNGVKDSHVRGTQVANNATYTCYKDTESNTYRLIVPPCELSKNAVFWLRDDERRYVMNLDRIRFEQGKLYKITMKVGTNAPSAEDGEDGGEGGSDSGSNAGNE